MFPFYEVETGDVLKDLFQKGWQSWAGAPVEVLLDPARTNLASSFVDPLELAGTRVLSTAAEAHNQLGKVEKHGHLFEVILQKVLDQAQPTCREEFEQCVLATCNSKNEMINNRGLSPVQHVFGRNPRIASDLLQDEPDPVAATSPLFDAQAARTLAIRTAARTAVAVSQDDISLRTALNAKPRVERDFVAGDFVSYWRTQKYMRGVRLVGGRWYGTGIVMERWAVMYWCFIVKTCSKCHQNTCDTHPTLNVLWPSPTVENSLGSKTLLQKARTCWETNMWTSPAKKVLPA